MNTSSQPPSPPEGATLWFTVQGRSVYTRPVEASKALDEWHDAFDKRAETGWYPVIIDAPKEDREDLDIYPRTVGPEKAPDVAGIFRELRMDYLAPMIEEFGPDLPTGGFTPDGDTVPKRWSLAYTLSADTVESSGSREDIDFEETRLFSPTSPFASLGACPS